jgi:hypothetical protein
VADWRYCGSASTPPYYFIIVMQVDSNEKAQSSEPVLGRPPQARQNGAAVVRKGSVDARRKAMLNRIRRLARAERKGWQTYRPTETGSVQSMDIYLDG